MVDTKQTRFWFNRSRFNGWSSSRIWTTMLTGRRIFLIVVCLSNVARYNSATPLGRLDRRTVRSVNGETASSQRITIEGDILGINIDALMARKNRRSQKDGLSEQKLRWPNATIPYVFAIQYDDAEQNLILDAMKGFDATCVRFIPRTNQTDYVLIAPGFGCSSYIGKNGGKQVVVLSQECLKEPGTIQHEFMHALGFYHEQARTDRDQYVKINWNNIQPEDRNQFSMYVSLTFALAYDFESVMHYDKLAFSRNGLWTIMPIDPTRTIGQRIGMSTSDIMRINTMYQCQAATAVIQSMTSKPIVTSTAQTDTLGTAETTAVQPSSIAAAAQTDDISVQGDTTPAAFNYEIRAGESLNAGMRLWNMNKNVKLMMRPDGNAVLVRTCDESVIWQSLTSSEDDAPQSLIVQADGNLVIPNSAGNIMWSSGTTGARFAGATLRVTNSGYLCLLKAGSCLWQSGGLSLCRLAPSPAFRTASVLLKSGKKLKRGQSVISASGACSLTLHLDGDLILRQQCDDSEIWSLRHGIGGLLNLGAGDTDRAQAFIMSRAGNLVVHRPNGAVDFEINIPNADGANLVVRRNCEMCVYKNGSCLWTAHSRTSTCS